MVRADEMANWMRTVGEELVTWDVYQRAAYRCLLIGFEKWESFDGLMEVDVALMVSDPAVTTCLTRLAHKTTMLCSADKLQQAEHLRRVALLEAQNQRKRALCSTKAFAIEVMQQNYVIQENIDALQAAKVP